MKVLPYIFVMNTRRTVDLTKKPVLIFTDGACSGNPGPGGWGAVILTPADEVLELGGRDPHTTNNRMEILAATQGLEKTKVFIDQPVQVLTDSTYVISGITRWIWGWMKKGWLTAEGKEVVNVDLWKALLKATENRKIEWKHVRGHAGIAGNERADAIAVGFSRGVGVDLYRGPLGPDSQLRNLGLSVVNDINLTPRTGVQATKKAYSYLSLIGGIPHRHLTWADCERRVKGRPGAKFKKTFSPEDEMVVLASWGFQKGWPETP